MKILIPLLSIALLFQTGCAHCPPEKKSDEMVVLIHGFGRSSFAMWKMADRLEQAGYDVYRVGYSSFTQDINGIVKEVSEKINGHEKNGYQKVHFVGHSLGGLLVRAYLGSNKLPNLGNAVILGSPNKGTPVVDHYKTNWWFSLAGPAVYAMSSNGSSFLSSLEKPYYPLGVIAGNIERPEHEFVLKGKDDGLVPLESTKVEGMKDFIVVNSGHSQLRSNFQAARQTIHFLKRGRFDKASERRVATALCQLHCSHSRL